MKYKYEIETLSGVYTTNDWSRQYLVDPEDPEHTHLNQIIIFYDQDNVLRAVEEAEINFIRQKY